MANTELLNKIEKIHLQFAKDRGREKTYCPSEVARVLFPNTWQSKMELVREIADNLVLKNKIEVLQKGVVFKALPSQIKEPIRLRIKD